MIISRKDDTVNYHHCGHHHPLHLFLQLVVLCNHDQCQKSQIHLCSGLLMNQQQNTN